MSGGPAQSLPRAPFVWALGYLLLAVLFTCPPPERHGATVLGAPADNYTFMWNFWWTRQAVARGVSPYYTDVLHHPDGVPLYLHTYSPLNAVAGAALAGVFPLALCYDLLFHAHLVAAGMAMAALARRLTRCPVAALVAGAVFALSPYRVGHAPHLNLEATAVLPLVLLAALRIRESGRARDGVLAAAAITAAGLFDWYLFLFAALAAGIAGGYLAATDPAVRTRRHLGAAVVALVGPLLLLLPLLARVILGAGEAQQNMHDPAGFSADLLAFVVPGPFSMFRDWTAPVWGRFTANPMEMSTFLGPATAALAVVGVASRGAHRGLLLALGLAGFLLSLGPTLHVAGKDLGVPMPYEALARLFPPIRMAGVPARYAVLADLALAGLAALGTAALASRIPRPPGRVALAALAVALRFIETAPAPFPRTPAAVPSLYHAIACDPRPLAVLDLWDEPGQADPLLHQTVHGKHIVAGYLARVPRSRTAILRRPPIFQLVARSKADDLRRRGVPADEVAAYQELGPEDRAHIERTRPIETLGIGWIVTRNPAGRALCEELGYRPMGEEGGRTLFRVP